MVVDGTAIADQSDRCRCGQKVLDLHTTILNQHPCVKLKGTPQSFLCVKTLNNNFVITQVGFDGQRSILLRKIHDTGGKCEEIERDTKRPKGQLAGQAT